MPTEIWFGILGQTALRMHDRLTVHWGERKTRAILGALLYRPGKHLSVESILDQVWSEDQVMPRDPASTLSTYAGRIRSAIADSGAPARLPRANRGLHVDVDPRHIDYFQFRSLMEDAHNFASEDSYEKAHTAATLALGQWQGIPLADISTEWADAVRLTLKNNHFIPANGLLIDAKIATGRFTEALHRLDELEHDLGFEMGFAIRRLQVLFRLGRLDEAQDYCFATSRSCISDGDPATAEQLRRTLAELHTSPPDPQRHTVVRIKSSRAQRLPHDIVDFTGRQDLLDELDALSSVATGRPRPRIIALDGAPGVGKTALAVRWAHRVKERFRHGVYFADMRGFAAAAPATADEVVDMLLSSFDNASEQRIGARHRLDTLRQVFTDRPALVILDNAVDSEHVWPLLEALEKCVVVITSRRRLTKLSVVTGASTLTVPLLERSHASALLTGRIGSRAGDEPRALRELISLCGGLPLALGLVADRVASRAGSQIATMVEQLAHHETLLSIGETTDHATSLRAIFNHSYDALARDEQVLLCLLGIHPGTTISVDTAAALAGTSAARARRGLDSLVGAHLLDQPDSVDRYRIHDLILYYASELSVADDERELARRRMLSFYLHTAANARRITFPHRPPLPLCAVESGCTPRTFTDEHDATRWCLSERVNLRAAIDHATTTGYDTYAWQIPHAIVDLLNRHSYYDDVRQALTIAVAAASRTGDLMAEAASLNDLAHLNLNQAHPNDAGQQLQRCLALLGSDTDHPGMPAVIHNLARQKGQLGRHDEAYHLYQKSLSLARNRGDADKEASSLHRIGEFQISRRQYAAAIEHLEEASSIRLRIGDVNGQAQTFLAIAEAELASGDARRAHAHADRARRLLSRTPHRPTQIRTALMLAEIALERRQHADAVEHAAHATYLAHNAYDGINEACALLLRGRAEALAGNLDQARLAWEQGMTIPQATPVILERLRALVASARIEPAVPNARDGQNPLWESAPTTPLKHHAIQQPPK